MQASVVIACVRLQARRCATRCCRESRCRRTSRRPSRLPAPGAARQARDPGRRRRPRPFAVGARPALFVAGRRRPGDRRDPAPRLDAAAGAVSRAQWPPAGLRAESAITEGLIRAHTKFLASDLLEGRGPPRGGDALAEAYIQAQLEGMGLEPGLRAADGSRRSPLVGHRRRGFPGPSRLSRGAAARRRRGTGDELRGVLRSSEAPDASIRGRRGRLRRLRHRRARVPVGRLQGRGPHGQGPADDEQRPGETIRSSSPARRASTTGAGTTSTRWRRRRAPRARSSSTRRRRPGTRGRSCRTPGAASSSSCPTTSSPRVADQGRGRTEELSRAHRAARRHRTSTRCALRRETRDVQARAAGRQADLRRCRTRSQQEESGNVVGRMPGQRPEALVGGGRLHRPPRPLRDQAGAEAERRHDLQRRARQRERAWASVLAVAKAFAALRAGRRGARCTSPSWPRRSRACSAPSTIVAHPPVPVWKIAADINIDEANWFGRTRDISLIGLGKSSRATPRSSRAGEVAGAVSSARTSSRTRGRFYRSDQFNFAKVRRPRRLPEIRDRRHRQAPGLRAGTARESTRRTSTTSLRDEYRESYDLSGAAEDARLAFLLGLRLASADAMPAWTKGDEFKPRGKKSLETGK